MNYKLINGSFLADEMTPGEGCVHVNDASRRTWCGPTPEVAGAPPEGSQGGPRGMCSAPNGAELCAPAQYRLLKEINTFIIADASQ